MRVTVYTKPDCHLCEDVLVILDRLTPQYDLQVTEVNILDDMALFEAYHLEIPVVEIEGGKLGRLKAPITEADLRSVFAIARHGMPSAMPPAQSVVRQPQGDLWIDRMVSYIGRHWLVLVLTIMGVYVGLPWLAPIFAALGWWNLANPIYTVYAAFCHQLPERSTIIFGYEVAVCNRCVALYGGTFMFGLLYAAATRGNVSWLSWLKKGISWQLAALLILPIAIDGFSHMFGLRDGIVDVGEDSAFGTFIIGSQALSLNWWLRLITGLMAALGVVWFIFPRMDRAVQDAENMRLAYSQGRTQGSPLPGTTQ